MTTHSNTPVTITLTGAAGQIGYATMFRIASGQLLGPNTPIRLNLLEIPQAMKALEGTAMELTDCAFPLLDAVNLYDKATEAFDGSNIGLLIGARPRTKGMERADLLEANAAIFSDQGAAINAGAAEDFRAVVVGNPANTNALIAASHAPDFPQERFTALTRLDHNRAVGQLALATGARVADIDGLAIWGNHSASQFPCIEHATVAGEPAHDALQKAGLTEAWVDDTFIPTVANRGAEIIAARGGSSVASAANAAIEHVQLWLTGQGARTSMAVPTTGAYGIDPGLISSFPVVCEAGEYRIVEDLELSDAARARIEASVQELRDEKAAVEALGLLGKK